MINLLPAQQKEEILQEKRWKLTLIAGIIILAFLICLVLMLFSIEIYISGQIEAQKVFLEIKEKEFESTGVQNLEKELNLANQTVLKLGSFYQRELNLTEILERVSGTLPPGTYLTTLSLTPLTVTGKEEFVAQVSLSGFAPTREILLELKENLEQEKLFSETYFPPSNWVKPTDIDFSVSFKIRQ